MTLDVYRGRKTTMQQQPFKHTSDVRKAEAQIRLRGYEYYSDLPSFEQFLVPNSRVFDKISCY